METATMERDHKGQARAKEGKYLTFVLGHEEYGLEILKVREIISVMEITEVPQVPVFIKGVINLRGKVIRLDASLRLGIHHLNSGYAFGPSSRLLGNGLDSEIKRELGNVLLALRNCPIPKRRALDNGRSRPACARW